MDRPARPVLTPASDQMRRTPGTKDNGRLTLPLTLAAGLHLSLVVLAVSWSSDESMGGGAGGGGALVITLAVGPGGGPPHPPVGVDAPLAETVAAETATAAAPVAASLVAPEPDGQRPPNAPVAPSREVAPDPVGEAGAAASAALPAPVREGAAIEPDAAPTATDRDLASPPPQDAVAALALTPTSAVTRGVARRSEQAPPPATEVAPAERPVTVIDALPPAQTPVRGPAPTPPAPAPAAPEPDPQPETPPAVASAAPPEPPDTTPGPGGTAAGEPAASEATPGSAPGDGAGTEGSGLSAAEIAGAQNDYFAAVNAHLARYKHYPSRARSRDQQGVVMLFFAIDGAGRLTSAFVEQSSGYPLLDEAAVEMVQRASPLPAIPPELGRASLELVVPVQFTLN